MTRQTQGKAPARWGNWSLNTVSNTLDHAANPDHNFVPLAQVHTRADVERWIRHVSGKVWASVWDRMELGRALDDLLEAARSGISPSGGRRRAGG